MRPSPLGLALLASLVLSSAAGCRAPGPTSRPSPPPASTADAERQTVARLRAFVKQVDRPDGPSDGAFLAMLDDVSRATPDEALATVERFAVSPEGRPVAWGLVRLFVDRGRFDAAANVMVTELLTQPDNREYTAWKWWAFSFGQRPDVVRLNARITEAMMAQFAVGTPDRRRVVADLYELGEEGAAMSPEAFRATVFGAMKR